MKRQQLPLGAGTIVLLLVLSVSCAGASATLPGSANTGTAPVAGFEAHYAFATVPTKVMFIDTSVGSMPLTWHWDFGDNSTSDEQNPVHMYLRQGTYTVSLTVNNAYGTSAATKTDFITIGMEPRADFSGSPREGSVPLTVKFTDLSLGQVSTWTWDFGDGSGSDEQNPVHTYYTGGDYTIALTTSNAYGSADISKHAYIHVTSGLDAGFLADPSSGAVPLTVTFTDRSAGAPTAWIWDFGDGATSSERNPVHRFERAGTYTVRLTVAREGIGETTTRIVNAGGVPITDFNATPRSGNIGQQIRFSDLSANDPTEWSWDFGDTGTSDAKNPRHAYLLKGVYTVSLTTKNLHGENSRTKRDYINIGIPPLADFVPVILPYQTTTVPLQVQFLDQSANIPTSWKWDFGDGQTSAGENPKHTYVNEGVYTVSLTAINAFGEDTRVRNGLILVNKTPVVDFAADRTTIGAGMSVTLQDLSPAPSDTLTWDFGDGSTGTGTAPEHLYRAPGVYDVTLTTSNAGQSTSKTRNRYITVLNIPHADFGADRTTGGTPMNVTFSDRSRGSPATWKWDFGDGTSSTEANPVHQYTVPGTFNVTLTVTNEDGKDTTTRIGFIVTTPAPVAAFRAYRQSDKTPFVVRFVDLSKGGPDFWSWDFGDGTDSREQNPSHIYLNEGNYIVRLTVSNQYGSDTAISTDATSVTETPAPRETETAVVTKTTIPPERSGTPAGVLAPTLKSPVSPVFTMFAFLAALLLAARGKR